MQLASPNDNQWYVGTTYEFHDVSELVAGSSTVPDLTGRDRTAEALVVEASRGITEKWSVSALLSAVNHEREVGGTSASASGLGDAIVMAKYSPKSISLYSDTALGGMLWAYWAKALNASKGARIYASASYTQNGENDRDYQFGDETTLTIGGAYQTQSAWGFNLELLYRDAERDQRNSVVIPNTGGEWLDVIPAVQYHVSETLALKAAAKIPLSRDLHDELQFTTKYAFRLSLSYVFGGI
jgi:hypothetical protein